MHACRQYEARAVDVVNAHMERGAWSVSTRHHFVLFRDKPALSPCLISQAGVKETMKRAQRCAEQNTTVRDVRDACGKVSFIFTLKEESMRPYVRRNQE